MAAYHGKDVSCQCTMLSEIVRMYFSALLVFADSADHFYCLMAVITETNIYN